MKNYKKFLAGALAATMAMSSSVAVFAAETGKATKGETTGTGSVDIVEESDIYNVVLPTVTSGALDYILDPTGVIKTTEAEKYNGATFADDKTVYFKNTTTTTPEGGGDPTTTVSYSENSDDFVVINKSTQKVELTVTASVAAVDGITMAANSTFTAGDKKPTLYLALTDGTNIKAITADAAELKGDIAATENAYKTTYDATDGKYVMTLDPDLTDDDFNKFTFKLTGACNEDGDWSALKDNPPTVNVVWTVKDFTGPTVTVGEDGVIKIVGLDGDKFVRMSVNDGTQDFLCDSNGGTWVFENPEDGKKEFALSTKWMAYFKGKNITAKVELKDGTSISSSSVKIPE